MTRDGDGRRRWNTARRLPTFIANSGVISPVVARPRIPSVPKYLRLMVPQIALTSRPIPGRSFERQPY